MGIIFSGKEFAEQILVKLADLPAEKRAKTLAVLLDPENLAGKKYVQAKQKVAERLGVEFKVFDNVENFLAIDADGKLVQLPFPNSAEIVNKFSAASDVDGMQEESLYLPATVRAVLEILDLAFSQTKKSSEDITIAIVGVWGQVGSRLANELGKRFTVVGMDREDFNVKELQTAQVIISATGQANLITRDMVANGTICIDIGFPNGDFCPDVLDKASFFTPVPGGVGPVTVACLFENLLGRV